MKGARALLTLGLATCLILSVVNVSFAAEPKLVAAFFVKGKIGLKWTKVDGVSEYAIYRRGAEGEFEKVATISDDHWFDTELTPGTTYKYKIAAVAEDGSEAFSGEKSVNVPGGVSEEFGPPTWSGVRMDRNAAMLRWDPVPSAMAYNIYRSETSGSGFEVVGNSQSSRYADKDGLERGTTYYYIVTALNAEFEETEYSEERSLKFGMSAEEIAAASEDAVVLEELNVEELFSITESEPGVSMNQPADVFLNAAGDMYVTDALNSKVHCFDSNGKHKFSWGEKSPDHLKENPPNGTFLLPFTLFVDSNQQVYVTDVDRHDIQVFSAGGEFVRRITVDVGEGMNPLRPNGIHVFDDGSLVVTDTGNHRFLFLDKNGRLLKAVGIRGGEPGEFNFPDELTVTADGTICIVDVINCRVQQFDLEGTFIREFGKVGQSAGTFARPKGIAVDEQGRLWVSDGMSNLIQCFTQEGEVKAAMGTAEDGNSLISPRGMFFRDGKLFLINRVPNRVSVYRLS